MLARPLLSIQRSTAAVQRERERGGGEKIAHFPGNYGEKKRIAPNTWLTLSNEHKSRGKNPTKTKKKKNHSPDKMQFSFKS